MRTTVSLVRHGLVENPAGVYYGRLPGFGLAERGRQQAAAAGRYLAGQSVAAVYHSPMLRAAETAQIICARLTGPVSPAVCELLNEVHSIYDGRPVEEMERRAWDFYSEAPPPYEQPTDVLARILRFFAEVCERHPGAHVIGVSHADPIAFAVMWANGRALRPEERKDLLDCGVVDSYPAPASVSTFIFEGDEASDVQYRYYCPPESR